MHELSIVEGILGVVIPRAQEHDVERITLIKLKIGEMSGIVPSCVHEYFKVAARGTIAEGARIDIESIPVTMECRNCGHKGTIKRGMYTCPSCGSPNFRIVGGNEYFVDSIEAE